MPDPSKDASFNPSRRQVAMAAAAFPFLWAPKTKAFGQAAKPSEQLTIGIIGCGRRMHDMFGQWAHHPKLNVLALCDVDRNRLNIAKAKFDEAQGNTDSKTYADYHELLARPDLDAVAILTPDHWHATQIIHAARAGKHIYCEKPLTHSIHESKRIVEEVKKAGITFQTGSQQRTEFNRNFARAVECVRNGLIGECVTACGVVGKASARTCNLEVEPLEPGLDWEAWQGPAPRRGYNSQLSPRGVPNFYPHWRYYHAYAGGYLADFGAHHFDIIQWAWDKDLTSPVTILPPDNPRNSPRSSTGAKAIYADGKTIVHGNTVEGSSMQGNDGAIFIGERGRIEVGRGHLWSDIEGLFDEKLPDGAFRVPHYPSHLDMFLDCCFNGKTPLAHIEAGARTATICHLLLLAYHHGRELTFDPKSWQFVNDNEANQWLEFERHPDYPLPV